jgi:hypothetical protein
MTGKTPGTVTLIGSGEMAESMAKVHRSLLARVEPLANAIFLDTPAGFELNADEISAKAVEYFKQHFNVQLAIATFKSRQRATAIDVEAALRAMYRANYIFAGPGSPSYAVRNWYGSPIWDMLLARLMDGAQLVFASAAAIATGQCALPVYEIYKAGAEPHWVDGLGLFTLFGLKLTVVPHWNNAEGGQYDTRFCFMGESRFSALEAQLPGDTVILGIDEYTACVLDMGAQAGSVMGAGQVTVRRAGHEEVYPAGAAIPFEALCADGSVPGTRWTTPDPLLSGATLYLAQLARAIDEAGEPDQQRDLIAQAHATFHALASNSHAHAEPGGEDIAPYVELLLTTRAQLRAAKQFALADEVRNQLSARGVQIEDTPTGTIWKRV